MSDTGIEFVNGLLSFGELSGALSKVGPMTLPTRSPVSLRDLFENFAKHDVLSQAAAIQHEFDVACRRFRPTHLDETAGHSRLANDLRTFTPFVRL